MHARLHHFPMRVSIINVTPTFIVSTQDTMHSYRRLRIAIFSSPVFSLNRIADDYLHNEIDGRYINTIIVEQINNVLFKRTKQLPPLTLAEEDLAAASCSAFNIDWFPLFRLASYASGGGRIPHL
jgi:hypothetical protein